MSKMFDLALRSSLWLLFAAAVVHALFIGWAGLTFGLSLWDGTNPLPTLWWLAALAFPIVLFQFTPRRGESFKHLLFFSLGAWAFVGYYLLFVLADGHILDCGLRWFC
jgi:hypothetical protein